MNTKDIADLFLAALGKVEFYWNFYVVMVLALIGWLFSSKAQFQTHMRVFLTIGYVLFALMNLIGLWGSYTFVEALRLDLLAAAKDTKALVNSVDVVSNKSFADQRALAVLIHLAFGAVTLAAIWLCNRQPEAEVGSSAPNKRIESDAEDRAPHS